MGDKHIPRWLNEGFAYLHSSDFSFERSRTLTGMAWTGDVIPLAEIDGRFPARELAAHRAYAQSCSDEFDGPSLNFEVIGYGLEDFSYVPFQKYEVWGSYVADAFPVQSDYFDTFTTGMAEFPAASFKDWTAPLGGPDIEFVDMMILSEREFAGWATSFATLLERIGCAGPTTDRLERNLLAAFELRRSV